MASYQLDEIYDAEDRAIPCGTTRQFPTMEAIRAYVEQLWYSDWFENEFSGATLSPPPNIAVRSSSAHYSWTSGDGSVIAIANNPQHRTIEIVLHELAHAMTPGHEHDALWRSIYLKLVRHEISFYAYVNLLTEFTELTRGRS